mgnify:CR=1 FL=1
METKTRTAAEIIEAPQVGDKLRCVKFAGEDGRTFIQTVNIVKVGMSGAVTFTVTQYTFVNGHESTYVRTMPRRTRDRWLATNFTGYEAA